MLAQPADAAQTGEAPSIADRLVQSCADRRIPVDVMLELTHRCNLRCRHCYLEGLPPSAEPELSTDESLDLMDQLAETGTLFLALTGGEPLMRRDLWTLLQGTAERGFAVQLFTNATLLDAEWASRLARLGTVWIDVSIHGASEESHDWLTRCAGSFQGMMAGVRHARGEGIKVRLKMPLTRRSFPEREAVKDLAASLGASVTFDPLITARNCGDMGTLDLRLGHEDLVCLLRAVEGPRDAADSGRLTCGAGVSSATVSPYGIVLPCVQLLLDCGGLRKSSFREIWRDSATLKMLRGLADRDIVGCVRCPRRDLCGRCPGLALLEDGDLLGPSSAACQVALAKAEAGALAPGPVG